MVTGIGPLGSTLFPLNGSDHLPFKIATVVEETPITARTDFRLSPLDLREILKFQDSAPAMANQILMGMLFPKPSPEKAHDVYTQKKDAAPHVNVTV